jgi:hypothetical protein
MIYKVKNMYLYRVDKRQFKTGAEILPNSQFENELQGEALQVENILNETRPNGVPERKYCLFLFHELTGALTFWLKYGGNIYSVIPFSQIYYMGDMNKIDNILDLARFSEDADLLRVAANEYWKDGTHTFKPCFEFLVDIAKVVGTIATERELQRFKEECKKLHSIERTSIYKLLLNR